MLNYNQIIELNREFAAAHKILKNFGNGQRWKIVEHNQQATFKYPLMWMEDLPHPSTPGIYTFAFRVYFLDQVANLKERGTDSMTVNDNVVKSDMIQCAQDLISFWAQDHDYPFLDVEKNIQLTPIEDQLEDVVTGGYFDLKITQAFVYNKCAIPMTGVTSPDSDEVSIIGNSVLMSTVLCGQTYSFSIVDQDGAQTGTFNSLTKTWTVDSGGDVSVTFNTVPVTSTPAGETKAVTFKNSAGTDIGGVTTDTAGVLAVTGSDISKTDSDGVVTSVPMGVNVVCTPAIVPVNSGKIFKTGATTPNNAGDDGAIKRGAGTDFFNLGFNNSFGHQKAYTGITGGYYDEVALAYKDVSGNVTTEVLAFPNNLMLNWKAWSQIDNEVFCMDYTPIQTGTVASMILASPYTRGGFTGFYGLNMGEYERFFNYNGSAFNWAPFSFNIGVPTSTFRVYSTTPLGTNYYGYVSNAVTNQLGATAAGTIFLGRYLNITTDLGL